MLTPRDKSIIFHIEKYGFCTIGQAYSIWFSTNRYGYDLARKHMAKCCKAGHIKGYRPTNNIYTEKVYYIEDKYARPTKSMVMAMNVYAELIRLGADMIYFKREEPWFSGAYRSDAFVICSIGKSIYSSCVEIANTTKLSYAAHRNHLIKKYADIYEDDEPLKKLMDITNLARSFSPPKLITISEIANVKLEIDGIEVISLDYTLQKLSQIFTTEAS